MPTTLGNDSTETVSLLWLNVGINDVHVQQELHFFVNHIQTFENSEDCETYMRQSKQDQMMLVVDGSVAEAFVPRIHDLRQLIAIYVYCFDKKKFQQWSLNYNKVKSIATRVDDIITQVKTAQRQRRKVEEPLLITIVERSSTNIDGSFLHLQLLLDVLVRMDTANSTKVNDELINLCYDEYKNDATELGRVREFKKEYRKEKALWWYTRESFVYRMMNRAFRTSNADVLILFRSVIRNIQDQLRQVQLTCPTCVFRGQLMSLEELSILKRSVGKLISMNSFLSASIDPEYVHFLLDSAASSSDMQRVLFEIDADPSLPNTKPFADITSFSAFPDEREILFMAGSIFHLISVHQQPDSNIYVLHLSLCSDDEHDVKELFKHTRDDIGDENNLFTLGKLLWKSGKLNIAEHYFRKYLNEASNDDLNIGGCLHALGVIFQDRGQYKESLQMYDKALDVNQRILSPMHPNIADLYDGRGIVYWRMGDVKRAIDSLEKALNIYKHLYGEKHQKTAACLNNMGLVYNEEKKYDKALLYYRQALLISEKFLPADHPQLAMAHYNIAGALVMHGEFDCAVEHFEIALKMRMKSLPPDHLDTAMSCRSMGLIYAKKGDLRRSLPLLEKAAAIYNKWCSPTHPDVIEIQGYIERLRTYT